MRTTLYLYLLLVSLPYTLLACSEQDNAPAQDRATSPTVDFSVQDSAAITVDSPHADTAPDRAREASLSEAGLVVSCAGQCAQQTLSASFGAVTEPLERSIYGVDRDSAGDPGIYIEALHGGFVGCPEESSPTPERTLVISGLPLPRSGPITLSDGLVVSLLDFKGSLLQGSPVAKATAASVTFVAADVCSSCVGQPAPAHPEGFVALELSATFPEGAVVGHLYAVHCDSFDL